MPAPLLVTTRIDQCTEGLVVLGMTSAFVARYNRLQQAPGCMRKLYRALSLRAPPLGSLVFSSLCHIPKETRPG